MDIEEFLQQLQRGDAAAAQGLVESQHSEIFQLALSILNDPTDAEDITQEVFIAALGVLDSCRGDSTFKTWLFSITINICRCWRKRKARERLMQTLQSVSPLKFGKGTL